MNLNIYLYIVNKIFRMSENQVLEQEVLENTKPQQKTFSTPVAYASLLSKLRQNANVVNSNSNSNDVNNNKQENQSEKNKRGFRPRQNGQKPRQNRQKNQDTQEIQQGSQENVQGQQGEVRLSPEDYLGELKKCQKAFFVHLVEYLKEEFVIKSENDKNKEVKIIKKTNLERIKDGLGVNVMRLFLDKSEKPEQKYIAELKYLDNLVTNRQMNFVGALTKYMNNYGIVTSFRGKNNIMIHSPYIVV